MATSAWKTMTAITASARNPSMPAMRREGECRAFKDKSKESAWRKQVILVVDVRGKRDPF